MYILWIVWAAEASKGIDPAWIALGGTVAGTLGLKFAEHWLGKSRVKIDDATKIRDELRLNIDSQKEEIRDLESAVDKWKKDYYDLRDKSIMSDVELKNAKERISEYERRRTE